MFNHGIFYCLFLKKWLKQQTRNTFKNIGGGRYTHNPILNFNHKVPKAYNQGNLYLGVSWSPMFPLPTPWDLSFVHYQRTHYWLLPFCPWNSWKWPKDLVSAVIVGQSSLEGAWGSRPLPRAGWLCWGTRGPAWGWVAECASSFRLQGNQSSFWSLFPGCFFHVLNYIICNKYQNVAEGNRSNLEVEVFTVFVFWNLSSCPPWPVLL